MTAEKNKMHLNRHFSISHFSTIVLQFLLFCILKILCNRDPGYWLQSISFHYWLKEPKFWKCVSLRCQYQIPKENKSATFYFSSATLYLSSATIFHFPPLWNYYPPLPPLDKIHFLKISKVAIVAESGGFPLCIKYIKLFRTLPTRTEIRFKLHSHRLLILNLEGFFEENM